MRLVQAANENQDCYIICLCIIDQSEVKLRFHLKPCIYCSAYALQTNICNISFYFISLNLIINTKGLYNNINIIYKVIKGFIRFQILDYKLFNLVGEASIQFILY